ncbi:RICIN domain-containing protein [Kribbella sp. NPDC005582]|uniref:RICIN domain-containing protein n=1 Tax=Kribbella sp. NPDC005582 TaxID=3156893 RepID=UPI0033AA30F0
MTTNVTWYHLVNMSNGYCMNIPGGSTARGAAVTQWPCGAWADHDWSTESLGNGYFWIRNRNSYLCISNAANDAAGAPLSQQPCKNVRPLWWKAVDHNGSFEIVNSNGMCIGVPGASGDPGVQLIQWPCGGWLDHRWFSEVS